VSAAPAHDSELSAKRERLVERFTVMQCDLGGLVYEMVARDSLKLDVLRRRVAELQRLDGEIGHLDRTLRAEESGVAGSCPSCEASYARGAAFCWRCGHSLVAVDVVGEAP
jgi:hypothetical protein